MSLPTLATAGGREFDPAYAGMVVNQIPNRILTLINSSATGIDFGVAVAMTGATTPAVGTDQQVKPWAADADRIGGISVRNAVVAPVSAGVVNYPQYANVPVILEGAIWVLVAEQVREGDEGLIITAGGSGNATAGSFGSSQNGVAGSGRVRYLNSRYLDTVASGKLARLLVQGLGIVGRTTT